jgi:hypothetical protein
LKNEDHKKGNRSGKEILETTQEYLGNISNNGNIGKQGNGNSIKPINPKKR